MTRTRIQILLPLPVLMSVIAIVACFMINATSVMAQAHHDPVPAVMVDDDASTEHAEVAAEGGGDHADGDHAKRELIQPVWQEMLWTVVVFGIFFGVLSVAVWPKILVALQAREDKQRGDLVSAEQSAQEAQKTLAEYQAQLAQARQQAGCIVDEARVAAMQVAAKVAADEETKQATQRKRATDEIESAKKQALSEIYAQAAVVSTQIAGRILAREIRPEDQQEIINQSLAELSGTLGNNN